MRSKAVEFKQSLSVQSSMHSVHRQSYRVSVLWKAWILIQLQWQKRIIWEFSRKWKRKTTHSRQMVALCGKPDLCWADMLRTRSQSHGSENERGREGENRTTKEWQKWNICTLLIYSFVISLNALYFFSRISFRVHFCCELAMRIRMCFLSFFCRAVMCPLLQSGFFVFCFCLIRLSLVSPK